MAFPKEDWQPTNKAEEEIAFVMRAFFLGAKAMREACPEVPETAISVGLINLGIQFGLGCETPSKVINYLHGAADRIEEEYS